MKEAHFEDIDLSGENHDMVRASSEILRDMSSQATCVAELDNEITHEIYGSLTLIKRQLSTNVKRMGDTGFMNEEVQIKYMSLMSLVDLIDSTLTQFKLRFNELKN
jgi:hypothetical protein